MTPYQSNGLINFFPLILGVLRIIVVMSMRCIEDRNHQSFGLARITDILDAGLELHTSSAFALSSLTSVNYKLQAIRQRYRLVAYAGERGASTDKMLLSDREDAPKNALYKDPWASQIQSLVPGQRTQRIPDDVLSLLAASLKMGGDTLDDSIRKAADVML
ncbi:hypothetical protein Q7P35_007853 [Cladosporium inversicolor]